VVGTATLLPLGFFYASHPNELLSPLSSVALGDLGQVMASHDGLGSLPVKTLATQGWTSALGLVAVQVLGIYHPPAPMMLPLSATLFCFGALMLILKPRDPRSLILLTAMLGPILAGMLSIEAPNSHRMQFILPVMAIVAACLPAWAIRQARRLPSPAARRVAIASAYVTVALIAAAEARFFFVEAIPGGAYGDSATYASRVVSDFAANLPEGSAIILFGKPRLTFADFPSLSYLIHDHPTCDGTWPLSGSCAATSGVRAFIFLAEQQGVLEQVRSAYPTGTEVSLTEMPGNPPILVWVVSG
jgi:hypothetical protein